MSFNTWVLTGFDMLIFFINSNLIEFQNVFLALFPHFSVVDSFRWFLAEALCKGIMSMLVVFMKAPLLILLFSYCTLMIFCIMLFVLLLFMLLTTLFTPWVRLNFWFIGTARLGFWTWIWPERQYGVHILFFLIRKIFIRKWASKTAKT